MTNRATSEIVAVAWLLGVTGLTADADHVGTMLPARDPVLGWKWADSGFVQMVAVTGGTPGLHVQQREPVIQIDFWAVNADSGRPPWGKARELAELVIADTYPAGNRNVSALMPDDYQGAYVQSAYPVTEPRRVPGDGGSFARLTMDLTLVWVGL